MSEDEILDEELDQGESPGPTDENEVEASYSADKIAENQPIRKPFQRNGASWVCVGMSWGGPFGHMAWVYRLTPLSAWQGETTTYADSIRDGDKARSNPLGGYHGIIVRHAGASWVMTGPKIELSAAEMQPAQGSLFG